ncbi:MAG: hypothetical protein AAGI07_19915 [Bacteroidota bacterium]
MSDYPNSVGPDMIAVGKKLEKLGNYEKAKAFFETVILDFTPFVEDIASKKKNSIDYELDSDLPTVKSLFDALQGLARLKIEIDKSLLAKTQLLMNSIQK